MILAPMVAMRVFLLTIASACSQSRAIDLCGRGDRVEFPGGVRISFLDGDGSVLEFGDVAPQPSDHLSVDAPAGAVEILVEGRDGDGRTVAHGRGSLTDGDACVCVAQEVQYVAACEGIACRVQSNACRFVDSQSGEPVGARTIVIGENVGDTAAGTIDTFLRSTSVDGNFGQQPALDLSGTETAVLRFELSPLPTTSVIESSELRVFASNGNGTSEDVVVFRILEPWDEGASSDGSAGAASWRDRRAGTPWTVAGCGPSGSRDIAPLASSPLSAVTATSFTSPALNDLVQAWVREPATNVGVAMTLGGDAAIVSSQGQEGERPRLLVTYTLP